ncbi:MAG TPA: chemotaxis protein CheW [bacterium]
MSEEKYIVFSVKNKLFGIDTMMLINVVNTPEVVRLPFVHSELKGVMLVDTGPVPVFSFADGASGKFAVLVDSQWGLLGILADDVFGIIDKESLKISEDAGSDSIGELSGRRVFRPDLKGVLDTVAGTREKN